MLDINKVNFDKLVHIIKEDNRHCDYDTVVALAELYRMMITGKDDDAIYRRFYQKFADSEDENEKALYEQLKRISNLILKPVTNRILQPFNKVPRSIARTEVLQYNSDEQNTKLNEFQLILNKFWGTKSWDDWMNSRFLELSAIDPNSWVVIEFPETDGSELTTPYPYEVKAENAIDFEYENNILQYLVAMEEDDENGVEYNSYTLYGKDSVIKLSKVNKDLIKGLRTETKKERLNTGIYEDVVHNYIEQDEIIDYELFSDLNETAFVKIGSDYYLFAEFIPHMLGYVNAFRIGYLRDNYTDGRTFVNCFDIAIPYLLNTVKVSVEKDLTFALHAFPRRYQYEQPCGHKGCNKGQLSEGGTCPACKGTGTLITSSTQEVITIPLPSGSYTSDDILDLTKLFATDRPPTDIIQLQLDYIDRLVEATFATIFNSDSYVKANIKDTATAVLDDKENSYDALYPFAINFAHVWSWGIRTIADITDKDAGLMVSLSFGKDFSFETRAELMNRYKVAKDAGMSDDVLNAIEAKIIQLDNADNKDNFLKWTIKKTFDPFYGKRAEEIPLLLQSPEVSRRAKVLYSNSGNIWDTLEMKDPQIFKMNKDKIRISLNAEIDKMIEQLDSEKSKTTPFRIPTPEPTV